MAMWLSNANPADGVKTSANHASMAWRGWRRGGSGGGTMASWLALRRLAGLLAGVAGYQSIGVA